MALTAQTAANWTAAQRAWLRENDPAKLQAGNQLMTSAGLSPTVSKAQVDALATGYTAPVQGGVTQGSTAPKTTSTYTGRGSNTPNPYDDRPPAYHLRDVAHKQGGVGGTGMSWTEYGALPVNKDLKWDFLNVNAFGAKSYEDYLQQHWNQIGKNEYRIPIKQVESAKPSAPRKAPSYVPPPPAKKVTDPITNKEREAISRKPTGLADTIKTDPKAWKESRRRSYLVRGDDEEEG